MVHPPHQPTVNHRRPRRDTVGADADLAERTRAGDREAFAELYRLTVDLVTRYVAVRMRERDRDAIDDLVHDAYCDALADPALLQADVVGSMLRLAARACTRHRWSTNRYVRAAYTVYTDRHTAYDPLDAARPTASATPVRVTFVHALARLTPDQRRAIQLQLIDGYPRDAAAKAMGKSIQAIGSLQSRALRQLRRQLASPTPAAEAPPPVADRLTAQAGAALAR
jgi:RNA polymerase sigma-70 factor (ECF subfamily)